MHTSEKFLSGYPSMNDHSHLDTLGSGSSSGTGSVGAKLAFQRQTASCKYGFLCDQYCQPFSGSFNQIGSKRAFVTGSVPAPPPTRTAVDKRPAWRNQVSVHRPEVHLDTFWVPATLCPLHPHPAFLLPSTCLPLRFGCTCQSLHVFKVHQSHFSPNFTEWSFCIVLIKLLVAFIISLRKRWETQTYVAMFTPEVHLCFLKQSWFYFWRKTKPSGSYFFFW